MQRKRVCFCFFLCAIFLCGCKLKQNARTAQALGTVCTINAYADGTKQLYDALFERLTQIEKVFSTTLADSELNRVNAAAGCEPVTVSKELFSVLKTAKQYADKSSGLFDPTVGPLVMLWNIGSADFSVPSVTEIEKTKQLVSWTQLELDEQMLTVFLPQKGMRLDLGAIAKGYATDELAKMLKEKNVRCAVINLGGNVYTYGKKTDGTAWKVGIKNPQSPDAEPLLVATLKTEEGNGMSVVTSGAYERYSVTDDGAIYHHILNATTGYPSEPACLSATIVCSSSMDADALSTIAFMYGSERFLNSAFVQNCEAVFVELDGSVTATKKLSGTIAVYGDTQPVSIQFK